ncbi:AbgT family transporter [Anaerovoracaceae bacterium 41-7]|uniref:YfcC family protein n=1 Tax=Anaerotruncus colihominis TaxID=169435 RepID=A0A845QIZ8_9FIRM|nr:MULTISPECIES: AbgT family transporter [Anaerotruncus]NBH60098.1 YfcC family protein [Anaerotruncus colihominis]NCF00752.1 YfcC family protein [Anaerotruncus sp. 80]
MPITTRQKIILVEFVSLILIMLYGVFQYGWFMLEIATLFLIFSLIIGITGKISPNAMAKSFVNGAADMTFAALVVGIAKAILLTLQDGVIIDSILFYASNLLDGLPKIVAANGMYIFQCFLNFLIPSGSGQAAATIPIMAPLADTIGITRQVAVLAYHYGDGFTNLICPTLGSLMACIVVSKVPFEKYLKWVLPLCGIWIFIGFLSVSIATLMNLGPF